jgi:hypothetical protein
MGAPLTLAGREGTGMSLGLNTGIGFGPAIADPKDQDFSLGDAYLIEANEGIGLAAVELRVVGGDDDGLPIGYGPTIEALSPAATDDPFNNTLDDDLINRSERTLTTGEYGMGPAVPAV